MKFEEYRISPLIKKSLIDLGFKKPTDIQFKAITPILKGEDVLAIAQTGTGKTAAFAIPVLDLILQSKKEFLGPHTLVMAPTHELALQIADVFKSLAKHTKIRILAIHGSTDQQTQIEKLIKGVDVLVCTPGRMFDLRSQGFIDFRHLKVLILDEADHMLDLGFIKDIEDLIKYLPKNRQTLFFSATINPTIKKLAYSLVKNAIRIQISPDNPISKNITHGLAFVEMDDKRFFLERMLKENPDTKVIVFVRTKVRAERVVAAMARVGIVTESIHSDKTHLERKETMKSLKSGLLKVLIATDVSARGIDIPNVDYVINYDLPEEPESYVHRIGRTGRGVQKGQAFSFCSKEEMPLLAAIETYVGGPLPRLEVANEAYQQTIMFSDQESHTWKDVIHEIAVFEKEQTLRKRKKKKQ
jgi:ATP-dependent RNA helicase RhlE